MSISKKKILLEKRIKKKLILHLKELGYKRESGGKLLPPSDRKKVIRNLHSLQRRDLLYSEQSFLHKNASSPKSVG